MKKVIHAFILAVFGFGCWWAWAMLSLAPHVRHGNDVLPAFTIFCNQIRPAVLVLPALAAVYCVWVWCRKSDRVPSWVGFFAVTTGTLVLVMCPTMVAAYLPLLQQVNNLAGK
jgi:hypothetical protein